MSHLSNGLNGGSVFDQQFHHLHPVLLASDVERSETVLAERAEEKLIKDTTITEEEM